MKDPVNEESKVPPGSGACVDAVFGESDTNDNGQWGGERHVQQLP